MKTVLGLLLLKKFLSFFLIIFYNSLAASLVFTLALALFFDISGRVELANLPDITAGRVAFFLLASLVVIKLALRQQKVI